MAKDTFYFSHDFNTRNDEKIKALLRRHKWVGYGIFWAIIEELYNNANALRLDYEGIAYELRTDEDIVRSIINDFELFQIDGNVFGSASIERRIEERNEKSQTARRSAYKRWNQKKDANASQNNANASDVNANASKNDAIIKGNKGKEINNNTNTESEEKKSEIELHEKSIKSQYVKFITTESEQKNLLAHNNYLTKRDIDIACIGFVNSLIETGSSITDIKLDFSRHFKLWFDTHGKDNRSKVKKEQIETEFKHHKLYEYADKSA